MVLTQSSYLAVLLGGLLASLAYLGGVHLVVVHPDFTKRAARSFAAFAGGTVLGAAAIHLIPEAARLAPEAAGLATITAFLVLYLIESHTLPHVHGPHTGDNPGPHVHLGQIAILGFTSHALFDGLALGVGYRQGDGLVATTLIAVLAHKLPEGMALMSLLLHGGYATRRAIRYAWLVAAITPVSAVLSFGILGDWLKPVHMGILLASVAGSFIYISACDLLPEIRRNPRLRESTFIVAGVTLVWLLTHLTH